MNRHAALRAGLTVAAALLLSACDAGEDPSLSADRLDPCTASGTIFQGMDAMSMELMYTDNVNIVVDAQLASSLEMREAQLQCDADDVRDLLPPTPELASLASLLPPWQGPGAPQVSYADTASVLLEFLREYECSLYEREQYLQILIVEPNRKEFMEQVAAEKDLIQHEQRISRAALERTLLVLAGTDRLKPLVAETECIKRATLDLRNVVGLVAEAMSCMPRVFDARSTLIEFQAE